MKRDWIIGMCNSGGEGVNMCLFYGDDTEIKQKLYELVCEDRECDENNRYEYGCEGVDEIEGNEVDGYYAYAVYYDYHIDYTAKELTKLPKLIKE